MRDFGSFGVPCYLMVGCGISFPKGILSRVVSLSVMWCGLGLGVVVCGCFFCSRRVGSVYVCWVCCGCWGVWLTEGESCITVFHRVDEWELGISRTDCLVLGRLTGRDSWITVSSWGEVDEADVVLVGLCR